MEAPPPAFDALAAPLLDALRGPGTRGLLVVTGAGVSVASGIPTFRGSEGYWVVGSRNGFSRISPSWKTIRFRRTSRGNAIW